MAKKQKSKKIDLGATFEAVKTLLSEPGALTKGMKKRSRPPLIKPASIPIGKSLAGTVKAVMPSFKAGIKGELFLLDVKGTEVYFPITGVIKNALPDPKKEIGKKIEFVRLPDQMSGKWKKPMFVFDVFTG